MAAASWVWLSPRSFLTRATRCPIVVPSTIDLVHLLGSFNNCQDTCEVLFVRNTGWLAAPAGHAWLCRASRYRLTVCGSMLRVAVLKKPGERDRAGSCMRGLVVQAEVPGGVRRAVRGGNGPALYGHGGADC
jgi:hypothetical protein